MNKEYTEFDGNEEVLTDDFDTFEVEEDIPTAESTGLKGILDQKKIDRVAAKQKRRAANRLFIKWFEMYLNAIYTSFYTEQGRVTIKQGEEGGFINMESNNMILYDELLLDMWESGVPPLLVFYHEIGHLLYTNHTLINIGKSLKEDVFMLLNWIEDFYIEGMLMKELYYVKPYIQMLHEVVPDFIDDWEKPQFAFNYYYAFGGATPQWMTQAGIDKQFKNHIKQLLHLRRNLSSNFSQNRFTAELNTFFNFCVQHNILTQQTPPPPTQPQPSAQQVGGGQGQGQGQGQGGSSARGTGGNANVNDVVDFGADPNTAQSNPMGTKLVVDIDTTVQITPVQTVYKPLDPTKGFDDTLTDLMKTLTQEFDKQMYEGFKMPGKNKPELIPQTRNTTSPRNMVDPIAIATNQNDIYLEYITELQTYVGYNLFIDASGSVGYNKDYNEGIKKIIQVINKYPHTVYSFNDTLTKWGPKEISNVLNLQGTGGTESSLIAPVVLEKREANNLNIIFSDGDLSYLQMLPDFKKVKEQYLFVFFCVYSSSVPHYQQDLEQILDKKQFFIYSDVSQISTGLDMLKNYIRTKGR